MKKVKKSKKVKKAKAVLKKPAATTAAKASPKRSQLLSSETGSNLANLMRYLQSFPEYVQKAYKELKGRAAITHFINSAIVRTEKHELIPNLVFFKHVTKRMLVKSNKELSRGLIFEEACTRAGGPASLEQAVKRGAVKCMTLKGLDLYFFPMHRDIE